MRKHWGNVPRPQCPRHFLTGFAGAEVFVCSIDEALEPAGFFVCFGFFASRLLFC